MLSLVSCRETIAQLTDKYNFPMYLWKIILLCGERGVQPEPIVPILLAEPVSQPRAVATMFLTFATTEDRAKFLAEVTAERADLLAKLYSSEHQPTIVGRGLTSEEAEWLKRRAGERAKVHQDVKFSPMR